MPDYCPEDHPKALWLWTWSKEDTRRFFTAIGADLAFAPGPPGKAILKYIIRARLKIEPQTARLFITDLALNAGLEIPSHYLLQSVKVKPLQTPEGLGCYMEVPVALLPKSVAAEFGADLDRVERLLPQSEREPGRMYGFEETPDGYVARPDLTP